MELLIGDDCGNERACHIDSSSDPSDCVLVAAAVCLSGACFVAAALALHDLGLAVLVNDASAPAALPMSPRRCLFTATGNVDAMKNVHTSEAAADTKAEGDEAASTEAAHGKRLALVGAIVFCCSPANVFFSTAYSESTFAALSFHGARLILFSMLLYYISNDLPHS